jgi:Ca2+-binding RTX toxin-like protein
MTPADFGEYTDNPKLKWSFVGGHYQAIDMDPNQIWRPSGVGAGDRPEANALVLTGMVQGQKTLAIVIRGSDQVADFVDFGTFAKHYAKFAPLVTAIKDYLTDASNGISQVLIAGHSLGAGALQYFMRDLPDTGTYTVRGFTDGSPGAEVDAGDARINNFIHSYSGDAGGEHEGDPVPVLGQLSKIVPGMATKLRAGTDIFIHDDVPNKITEQSFFGPQHNENLYLYDLAKVASFANEGPFYNSGLASALRANVLYTGSGLDHPVHIAVGRPLTSDFTATEQWDLVPYSRDVYAYREDDYVLANRSKVFVSEDGDPIISGNDNIIVTAANLLATVQSRSIDGASGDDTLVVPFRSVSPFGKVLFVQERNSDGGIKLTFIGDNDHNSGYVGTLYNIERIQYLDKVEALDGHVLTVQRPQVSPSNLSQVSGLAAGASGLTTTMVVDHAYDYADAGDGDLDVLGTDTRDIIYLGHGNKTIRAGDDDDTIVVTESGGTDRITIDGGPGIDLIIGGNGVETYYVDNAGDDVVINSPAGHHTIFAAADYTVPENVDDLILQDGALFGAGNSRDNNLVGNTAPNDLQGLAGNDAEALAPTRSCLTLPH